MDVCILPILLTGALRVRSLRLGVPSPLDLSPRKICRGADVIIIEIKCTISAIRMTHPENHSLPSSSRWRNRLPRNRSLVPKKWLGTAGPKGPAWGLRGMSGLELEPSCSPSSIPGSSSKEEMSRAELLKTSQEASGEEEADTQTWSAGWPCSSSFWMLQSSQKTFSFQSQS